MENNKEKTLNDLEEVFLDAIEKNYKVAVQVTVPGCEKTEVIVNPPENLKHKLDYYKKAYNDDLTLKAFNEIKIVGVVAGKSIRL